MPPCYCVAPHDSARLEPNSCLSLMNDVQQQTSHLWLPFTQMRDFDRASRTFVRGEGNELFDARGKGVFDAVSSIWTIVHGHCHPAIVEAIARQAARLDHATLLGATNPVAERLA